jgi:ATP phosphoribosyltransferase
LAIPSKGRLQDQTVEWLNSCGLSLKRHGSDRGYSASLVGGLAMDVMLVSAREIAHGLHRGEFHLGITGNDLLTETASGQSDAFPVMPLGFGRADLVVAVPDSWIDVTTMSDLDDVADRTLHRRGRPLRVATKYHQATRAFFRRHGVGAYRIVDSQGATEGAPASGQADVIVDITSTGSTLRANHLRILSDGLILESQAQLMASRKSEWTKEARSALFGLVSRAEAHMRARECCVLQSDLGPDITGRVLEGLDATPTPGSGWIVKRSALYAIVDCLRAAGGDVTLISEPELIFHKRSEAFEGFERNIG